MAEPLTTETQTVNMDGVFTAAGWGAGIAWRLRGYKLEWTEETWEYVEGDRDEWSSYIVNEPEEVENRDWVRAVMVGDDAVHLIEVSELTEIGEGDYCPGCGQIPSCYGTD